MYTERQSQLHEICFLLSSLFSNWKITSYAIAPNSKFYIHDHKQKFPAFDKSITNDSNFKNIQLLLFKYLFNFAKYLCK